MGHQEASVVSRVAPSPLRLPLSILVGLAAPPLGLMTWIGLSGRERVRYFRSRWVRGGLAIGLASALPLLIVGFAAALGLTSDPNPNPIGLGLLFVAGGTLGTLLLAIGVVLVGRSSANSVL